MYQFLSILFCSTGVLAIGVPTMCIVMGSKLPVKGRDKVQRQKISKKRNYEVASSKHCLIAFFDVPT